MLCCEEPEEEAPPALCSWDRDKDGQAGAWPVPQPGQLGSAAGPSPAPRSVGGCRGSAATHGHRLGSSQLTGKGQSRTQLGHIPLLSPSSSPFCVAWG